MNNKVKFVLLVIGYLFVAGISVFMACVTQEVLFKTLLIVSSAVSLTLAISRLISSIRMEERVKELEHNQLTFVPDEDCTHLLNK